MSASGTLIAYSSAPGQASEDGSAGTDSVYTRSLAKEMLAEDVQVEKMFKNVLVDVLRETREQQVPWVNSSLTVDFSFNPTRRGVTEITSAPGEARHTQKQVETVFARVPRRDHRASPRAAKKPEPPPLFDEAVKAVVAKRIEQAIEP